MFKILDKNELVKDLFTLKIVAPRASKSIKPGQFVMIRIDEKGERIPLSVCDFNKEEETITVVFNNEGSSLEHLSSLNVGDEILDFVGPLGEPSILLNMDIDELKEKRIIFVSEDSGSARIYPEVAWLYSNNVLSSALLGFKNSDELVYKKEIEGVRKEVFVSTLDGSIGNEGYVCETLKDVINKYKVDIVVAMGSTEMMSDVSNITKAKGIKTIVSLTTLMLDGTGMCGACRLTIGGEVKFACQEGPEFDGHLVDYDEVIRRQKLYSNYETKKKFRDKYGVEHKANEEAAVGKEEL